MAYQSTAASGSSANSSLQFLNSPFGDTTYTKVFVGGLAWETQSETLYRYFIQFGEILEAVVITDKHTGKSKGYGFVTFRDPESARKACANPGPVIDGRRANCNLASLGRIRPFPPHGNLRSATPFLGVPRGTYAGSPTYHQSVTHSYPQGYGYSPFMYAYGSEYAYPQGFYNPYTGQQYIQMYSLPGTIGSSVYPFGQFGQPIPSGHRYNPVQGYAIPPLHVMQLNSSSVFGVTQPQYSTGPSAPTPAQTQFMVSASPKFMHGSGSDQTTG